MNAKEYFKEYFDTEAELPYSLDAVEFAEYYHQAKSKEEAGEMENIDQDGLRDLFIKHGAVLDERYRKGRLNCTELDANALIWELATITEEALKLTAFRIEITEEEIDTLTEGTVHGLKGDDRTLPEFYFRLGIRAAFGKEKS